MIYLQGSWSSYFCATYYIVGKVAQEKILDARGLPKSRWKIHLEHELYMIFFLQLFLCDK